MTTQKTGIASLREAATHMFDVRTGKSTPIVRKRPHTSYLEAASDQLLQDREVTLAAGQAWPEELAEAHRAIRAAIEARK